MRLLELLNGDAALLREENAELRKRATSAALWKQRAFIWTQRVEEIEEKHKKTVAELSAQYADELQKRLELAARVRELEDKRHVWVNELCERARDCDYCSNLGSEHCKRCVVGLKDGKRVSAPSHFAPIAWWEESEDDI